ncbi:MFS transporter [Myceligenerans pegani]|uniref:MFS transporter n=1 Tax=Myceligenerans pegani TaxID=2776917 RepID=A0ABR9N054_9MICO|nr:MFS transporter [Myceligenerans sp. TRM 65318]MBE1877035.1 MFS transporter [Myceligenerans sp. TRM 65318]MBE3019306.1 MFS transporter [Myceligenerans sp. TRM 65318]
MRSNLAPQAVPALPPEQRSLQRRAVVALVALSTSAFMFVTAENLPGGLLTIMAGDLGRTTSQVGLLVTAYAAVVVVATVPLAHLTRRFSRRVVLAGTTAVCAAGLTWSAFAVGYADLMASRVVTALGQALFWAIVMPAAASMFPREVRGRMIARLAIGNSLGPMLGVPFGTWLGQLTTWRTPFLVMAGISALACAAILLTMPDASQARDDTSRGTHPDRRRFVVLLAVTLLLVTGAFAWITFITQFLLEVAGFADRWLSVLLLGSGAAGLVGTLLVGLVLDRWPWWSLAGGSAGVAVFLLVLQLFGAMPGAAVVGMLLFGTTFSFIPPVAAHLAMQVAPGRTEMATAVSSAVFNIGIASGAALGAYVVATWGPQFIPLAGAIAVLAALALTLWDMRYVRRASRPPAPDR